MSVGLGLGLGLGAGRGGGIPDWRAQAAFSETWSGAGIASSAGNVTEWDADSGIALHKWSMSTAAGTVVTGTVNGQPCATAAGAGAMQQNSNSATFVSTTAGYVVVAVKMAALGANSATPGLCPGVITDGFPGWGIAVDSGNGGEAISWIYNAGYLPAGGGVKAQPGLIDTTHVKIIETWWDNVNVYVRVNGGTTFQSAAAGPISNMTTPVMFIDNSTTTTRISGSIMAVGMASAVPTAAQRNAVVSAMMSQYGAA